VHRKKRVVARVRCENIKNDCPKPTCEDPVLLPERCCKTCPGEGEHPLSLSPPSPFSPEDLVTLTGGGGEEGMSSRMCRGRVTLRMCGTRLEGNGVVTSRSLRQSKVYLCFRDISTLVGNSKQEPR
ncbi:hypothetical protein IscW_ISCW017031, partial [Ixodes scapularis]